MSERWSSLVSLPGEPDAARPARPTAAERAERIAFTVCKVGTVGLLAWLLTPPIVVLLAALLAVALYGRAIYLGVTRSRCILRRPALIMAFWAAVALADLAWLTQVR